MSEFFPICRNALSQHDSLFSPESSLDILYFQAALSRGVC
jgi:hypothetical protein